MGQKFQLFCTKTGLFHQFAVGGLQHVLARFNQPLW